MHKFLLVTTGLLTVCFLWVVLFCILAGWGALIRSRFEKDIRSISDLTDSFWIGFAMMLGFLQVWHVFLPINWKTDLVVLAVGLIGATKLKFIKFPDLGWRKPVFLIAVILVAVWAGTTALKPSSNYDSGLYHFNMLSWINEYSIVPGLGNLHGRLAFDQSYFLYVALLNIHPFLHHGHNLANGLMLMVLMLPLIATACDYIGRSEWDAPGALRILLLPVVLSHTANNLSSPSATAPVFVLGVLLITKFVDVLFASEPETKVFTVFFISMIGIATMTIKLSAAAFALSLLLLMFAVFCRIENAAFLRRKMILWACIHFTVFIVPWSVRECIVSGYPAYPSTAVSLPVDWKIPKAEASRMGPEITAWARKPHTPVNEVMGNSRWIKPWLKKNLADRDVQIPLGFAAVSFAVLAFLRKKVQWRINIVLPLVAAGVWISYCLVMAPDPNFMGPSIWILGLWSVAFFLSQPVFTSVGLRRSVLYGILIVVTLFSARTTLKSTQKRFQMETEADGFCAIPKVELKSNLTKSGLLLTMPALGDQSWDAPLPATPYHRPNLEMRGKDLSQGFRQRTDL